MIEAKDIYQLEEKAEDAILAHVRNSLSDHTIKFYPALSTNEYAEPSVFFGAMQSDNLSENAGFTGHRTFNLMLTIRTAAFIDRDESYRESRTFHAELRSRILYVLDSAGIVASLNAIAPDTLIFSMANIGQITRSADNENNAFVSTIAIECIVNPEDDEVPDE
jgi:hypothetical protein